MEVNSPRLVAGKQRGIGKEGVFFSFFFPQAVPDSGNAGFRPVHQCASFRVPYQKQKNVLALG